MGDHDRELGAINARLNEIDRRLALSDDDYKEVRADIQELTKVCAEISRSVTGITAGFASMTSRAGEAGQASVAAQPGVNGPNTAVVAGVGGAAGVGALLGSAVFQKIAAWLGVGG